MAQNQRALAQNELAQMVLGTKSLAQIRWHKVVGTSDFFYWHKIHWHNLSDTPAAVAAVAIVAAVAGLAAGPRAGRRAVAKTMRTAGETKRVCVNLHARIVDLAATLRVL